MAYEDFTTFTEADEGNDITVDSAAKVSWIDLYSRFETGYLYKDKGVDHFAGDFTHKFEVYDSKINAQGFSTHWMISNIVGDVAQVDVDQDGAVFTLFAGPTAYLRIFENGVAHDDTWAGAALSTLYFIELVRDDDGGANNTGRYTVYIRTGSHSGALQDTLVVDCSAGEQNDFRYIYAAATWDTDNTVGHVSGYTQNFDIGEAAAGWTGKIAGVTNPAKINRVEVANIASVMGQ